MRASLLCAVVPGWLAPMCAPAADPLVQTEPPAPVIREVPPPSFRSDFTEAIGGRPAGWRDLAERYGVSFKLKATPYEDQAGGVQPSALKVEFKFDPVKNKFEGSGEMKLGPSGGETLGVTFGGSYDGETYAASGKAKVEIGGTGEEGRFTFGSNQEPEYEVGFSRKLAPFVEATVSRKEKGEVESHAVSLKTRWFEASVDPQKALQRYATVYGALGEAAQSAWGRVITVDTKRQTVTASRDPAVGGVLIQFDLGGFDDELPPEQMGRLDSEIERLLRGETEGFVFQFGDCGNEEFVEFSLKQWLAAGERSLSPLTRVRGYALTDDDVILLGQVEPGRPPVDGDLLTVALNAVYRDGQSPFVSLDPSPFDFSGDQHARIGGVPKRFRNTEFVRVMLEADYDMKKIMLGEVDPVIEDLETTYRLVQRSPDQVSTDPHRFWLTPMTNLAGDVRVGGQVVLFYSAVEVLTEREKMVGDYLVPTGDASALSERAAFSFTRHYGELEQNFESFYRLHQAFDASKLAAVLRFRGVRHALLDQAADRDVERVEIRESYPGIGPKLVDGTEVFVMGGATARHGMSRVHFIDVPELAAARTGERRIPCQELGRLPAEAAPELLVHDAVEDLAQGDLSGCVAKITRALESDPELPDGYAYRGLARYELGDAPGALDDLDRAVRFEPRLKAARAFVRVAVGDETGARDDMAAVLAALSDDPEVWKISAALNLQLLDLDAAQSAAARALEMRPLDGETLGLHSTIQDFRKMPPADARSQLLQQRQLPLPLGLAFQRGAAAMQAEQLDEAVAQLERAERLCNTRYADNPVIASLHVRERIWMLLSLLHSQSQVLPPLTGIIDLALSPDGRHVAYAARRSDDKYELVRDGRESELIGRVPFRRFTDGMDQPEATVAAGPDAEGERDANPWEWFWPGEFPRVVIDESGKHTACVTNSDGRWLVQVDERVFGPFAAVLNAPRFVDAGSAVQLAVGEGDRIQSRTYQLEPLDGDDPPESNRRVIANIPAGWIVQHVALTADSRHVLLKCARRECDANGFWSIGRPTFFLNGTPVRDVAMDRESELKEEGVFDSMLAAPQLSPDGTLVYVTRRSGGFAVVHGLEAGPEYDTIDAHAGLALSADGRRLAYLGGRFRNADGDENTRTAEWFLNHDGVESLAPQSRNGGQLVMNDDGSQVAFISADGGQLFVNGQMRARDADVHSVTFAPDGRLAFVAEEIHYVTQSVPEFRNGQFFTSSIQFESATSTETRRSRRQYESLARALHAGLTTGFPGVANELLKNVGRQVTDRLPQPHARLYVGGKLQARHDEIEMPTLTADGRHVAWAARIGQGWHVFVDGKPVLRQPSYRYADQLARLHPDWRTPKLLMAIAAMAEQNNAPVDAVALLQEAQQGDGVRDPLLSEVERRLGSAQLREMALLMGAASNWFGTGNWRPYLKELRDAGGLPGDFARTFMGMIHPQLPNRRAVRELASRAKAAPLEQPADAMAFGMLVVTAVASEMNNEIVVPDERDPAFALDLIRALHTKLPARPRDNLEARFIRLFRPQAVQMALACYQELATGDASVSEALQAAFRGGRQVDADFEFDLDAAYAVAHTLVQPAREDSRRHDAPLVNALIEAQLEGWQGELITKAAQGMFEGKSDDAIDSDRAASFARQVQAAEEQRRVQRFERVYELLSQAVRLAKTPADIATVDALIADPQHYQWSIPVGNDPSDAARAVIKLGGLRSQLRMRNIAGQIESVARAAGPAGASPED